MDKLVWVIIRNDYESPLSLVAANSHHRKLAKRYPNQYRLVQVTASTRGRWRAEYARFDKVHAEVAKAFNAVTAGEKRE